MVTYFTQVVTSMLDNYSPQRVSVRHSNDKSWVTHEFWRLIRRRQHALTAGNDSRYHYLRNAVNRASKQLHKRHYERKIWGLHECNSANCWRETQCFTGHSKKSNLCGIINSVAGGDVQTMANLINESLVKVADKLAPIVDCNNTQSKLVLSSQSHREKLISGSRRSTYKKRQVQTAFLIGSCVTFQQCWQSLLATYITVQWRMDTFLLLGRRQMLFLSPKRAKCSQLKVTCAPYHWRQLYVKYWNHLLADEY